MSFDAKLPSGAASKSSGADVAVTIVPMPLSVSISSMSACGVVPFTMWARWTPASSASTAESSFGIMPPVFEPSAMICLASLEVRLATSDAGSG